MIDTKKFLGLSEEEARKLANSAGYLITLSAQPGLPILLTAEHKSNRIELTLNNGFVTAARVG